MVYVDEDRMIADTPAELLTMAEDIGINSRWIQDPGTYRERFDITASRRRIAIIRGAVAVSESQLGQILMRKRQERLAAL